MNKTFDPGSVGRMIRVVRADTLMDQRIVADRCGISQSYLSLIERGHRTPTLDLLIKIAEVLNCKLVVRFKQRDPVE